MTHTTNNRMELRALIETLKYFKEPSDLTIVSDSQYVISLVIHGSAEYAVRNNDLNRANYDLLFELVELLPKHKLDFVWVKGHEGNKWNEEADKWCVFAARCYNIPRDI